MADFKLKNLTEGNRVRVRVDLDAVYYFVSDLLASDEHGDPGWYLEDGSRTLVSGPYPSLETASNDAVRFSGRIMPVGPEYAPDNTTRELAARTDPADIARDAIVYPHVVLTRKEKIQIGSRSRIDDFVKLEGGEGLTIGNQVHVASFCHVNIGGGMTVLSSGSSMGSGAKTITGGNMPHAPSCSRVVDDDQQVLATGAVILEENACLYANAIVYCNPHKRPSVVIGRGARVGAGAFVTKDVPPFEIWGGSPARKVGEVQTDEADAWRAANPPKHDTDRCGKCGLVRRSRLHSDPSCGPDYHAFVEPKA